MIGNLPAFVEWAGCRRRAVNVKNFPFSRRVPLAAASWSRFSHNDAL
jgi:hypothetical protein